MQCMYDAHCMLHISMTLVLDLLHACMTDTGQTDEPILEVGYKFSRTFNIVREKQQNSWPASSWMAPFTCLCLQFRSFLSDNHPLLTPDNMRHHMDTPVYFSMQICSFPPARIQIHIQIEIQIQIHVQIQEILKEHTMQI